MSRENKTSKKFASRKRSLELFFAAYDIPFGTNSSNAADKLFGYQFACEGYSDEVVENTVKEFLAGKVYRPRSKRNQLPTSDEFGSHLEKVHQSINQNQTRTVESDGTQVVAKFGPAWIIVRLAAFLWGDRKDVDDSMPEPKRSHAKWPCVAKLDGPTSMRLPPDRAISQETLDQCVPITVGSPDWDNWDKFHRDLGWLMVNPSDGTAEVWFPTKNPKDWEHYQEAMKSTNRD